MPDTSRYASKTPDADGRFAYTPEEDAVWGDLYRRQMKNLRGRVAPQYLDGVAQLGLADDAVPQIADIDARLVRISGAGVEGVPAIIPPSRFFELLSQRRFPVATFLRRREDMDYIEEPDLFHEVFGHCPMLTQPDFADFIESFGQTALRLGKDYSWQLFRLFWFTVEFGMIRTPEGLRAFGAGIVSSPSETANAFSGRAGMRPFDTAEIFRTPYRIDIVQPVYFVIDSLAQLAEAARGDLAAEIDAARVKGDLPPRFDPKAA